MHNGFDDLDLDRLRRRRSEKWRLHPPDVLPAFIAEMDYDLAEPVLAALCAAVDRSDCGYATLPDIGETFAAFAAARHGWTVDPGRVHLVPDVMAGFDAILALATEPGDGVVINTPVYPPFFKHIGFARRQVVEVPLVRVDGRWDRGRVRRGRALLPALQPAQPDRAGVQPGGPGPDRVAGRAVRRARAGRRDPRLAHPARRPAHAVRRARRRGGRAGDHAGLGV